MPLLAVQCARADSFPLWEAGLGLSVLSFPDYRSSDQNRVLSVPIPYFVYRGERLRLDRQSLRTVLLRGEQSELDLSFAAAPPVSSSRNWAREGMPDLDPVIETGLSWKLTLWEADGGDRRLRLKLPLRGALATDLRALQGVGWLVAPGLKFDSGLRHQDRWRVSVLANLQWAGPAYHNYFYGVDPAYATTQRPAFEASGGYGGATLTFTASRRIGRWWLGAFARYDHLQGAVFDDSPLFKARHNGWGGIAVSRVLLQSGHSVAREE